MTTSKAFVVSEEDEEDILMRNVLQPFVTLSAFEKDRKKMHSSLGAKGEPESLRNESASYMVHV